MYFLQDGIRVGPHIDRIPVLRGGLPFSQKIGDLLPKMGDPLWKMGDPLWPDTPSTRHPPTPIVYRMIDTYENITFPHTPYAVGNKLDEIF